MKAAGEIESAAKDGVSAVQGLIEDVQRLVKLEIQLAKQEATSFLKRNGITAVLLVVALVGLALTFLFVQVWLILLLPHHTLVAGIVTLFWLLLAAVLALIGVRRIKRIKNELPRLTIDSLKEDLAWAKQQLKPEPK